MPKYCTAPNCKNDSGNSNYRKSFYKFPLHDPSRLKQWLKNMGRDNWIPSRHQYICHEHFTASCFKLRWGVRYLENDAVPTVFNMSEKGIDHSKKTSKRFRYHTHPRIATSDDETPVADAVDTGNSINTVQLYEITVEPFQSGDSMLVETCDVNNSVDFFQTTVPQIASVDKLDMEADFPVTLFQTVEDVGEGQDNAEILVVSECPSVEGQEDTEQGVNAAILTQSKGLLDNTHEGQTALVVQDTTSDIEDLAAVNNGHGTQVIAYFETIPNVIPHGASLQYTVSPDTVLSSALSPKPIVSTLPIVSNHMPSFTTSLERVEADTGEEQSNCSEKESTEPLENQMEEHCYHKNSLSKEQLETIVTELQKKVKWLQQRHRRHLEKLLGLENTISKLRQNNMHNEERLQLLEKVYIQTSAAVSEAGETVAIIYEEDNTAFLCASLNDGEEEA